MRTFFFDTETHPIEPGIAAPALVCLQYAYDEDSPRIALRSEAEAILEAALDSDALLCAFNSAFDWVVACRAFPRLIPKVFRALSNKRGRDLMLRETLRCIKGGTLDRARQTKGYFRLASLAERFLHKELSKGADSWQTRYWELDGVAVSEWPREAVEYAVEDILTLQELSALDEFEDTFEDEWLQTHAAFCLQLAAVWGVRVDGVRLNKLVAELEAEQISLTEALVKTGLMDEEGTLKKSVAEQFVVEGCRLAGIEVPRTEKGNIKTDKQVLADIEKYVPALALRADFKGNQKVLSTYLEPMKSGVHRAMNSRPNVLVASGRTSWAGAKIDVDGKVHIEGTNLQNFPQKGGVRDCIVPRPGFLWLGCDFSSLELRTLAQCCLWICDRSTLADGYRTNPDYDPHTEFGAKLARISKEEAYRLTASKDKEFKQVRQRAKAANFGYPGGLGAKSFQTYAKGYGLELTLSECYRLKDEWLAAFPEMSGYFDWVNYIVEDGGDFRQFVSGRWRGGTGFCDGANTNFQGLAADGFKLALCAVSQACYAEPRSPLFGSRIVAAIHDELDLEVPRALGHETAMEVKRLMEREMQKVTPDVPHKVVPALSSRWLKEAEERYENGRLVPWEKE